MMQLYEQMRGGSAMKNLQLIGLFLISLVAFEASADRVRPGDISVEIVDARGRELSTFDTHRRHSGPLRKAYVQALPGQEYGIRITNHTNERLAFVVAVDGRNIISGKRSKLKSKERKYVINPYQTATYRGWRSSKNRVNEFYFTDEDDSYSAAFGDYSAMGVIAVAAFRDRDRYEYDEELHYESRKRSSAPRADSSRSESYKSAPGTGYGDERYSRSRRVSFDAERKASATFLFKYEWRETLCDMGVTNCYSHRYGKRNRMWNDDRRYANRGYAPPPPRYRSYNYRRNRY